jgi:DNA-binding protein HU-beta
VVFYKKDENIFQGGYTMNKADLILIVAERARLSKKDAEEAVNAMLDTFETALVNGEAVKLSGFGGFEVRQRRERKGISPHTGGEIVIPGGKTIVFKPSKILKNKVQ